MKYQEYKNYIEKNRKTVNEIYRLADETHKAVNQLYDENRPYSYHLSMCADAVMVFGNYIFETTDNILPVIFAAFFHDSIEDARLTYNDLLKIACTIFERDQAVLAADIVYALTNEKGKTRKERANDKYYLGIRETPYAPFVKMCDRYANIKHSFIKMQKKSSNGSRMFEVYKKEWPEFIDKIFVYNNGLEYEIPNSIIDEIEIMLNNNENIEDVIS